MVNQRHIGDALAVVLGRLLGRLGAVACRRRVRSRLRCLASRQLRALWCRLQVLLLAKVRLSRMRRRKEGLLRVLKLRRGRRLHWLVQRGGVDALRRGDHVHRERKRHAAGRKSHVARLERLLRHEVRHRYLLLLLLVRRKARLSHLYDLLEFPMPLLLSMELPGLPGLREPLLSLPCRGLALRGLGRLLRCGVGCR